MPRMNPLPATASSTHRWRPACSSADTNSWQRVSRSHVPTRTGVATLAEDSGDADARAGTGEVGSAAHAVKRPMIPTKPDPHLITVTIGPPPWSTRKEKAPAAGNVQ